MVTTSSSYKKIALDTNIFIYVFEKHPEFGEKSKWLLERVEEGTYSAVASTITLTEILVKPIREANLALEKQYKLLFAHFPNLSVVPVNNPVAETAAYLRGKYGMKTPDALVVASAIIAQADVFVTNDLRLEHVDEINCKTLEQL